MAGRHGLQRSYYSRAVEDGYWLYRDLRDRFPMMLHDFQNCGDGCIDDIPGMIDEFRDRPDGCKRRGYDTSHTNYWVVAVK